MKKSIIAAAVIMAFALSAQAGNGNANPCGNNGNNCNVGTPGAGGSGGHGGQGGVGVGVGIGQGGNATGGTATVGDIRNTNTNTAIGGTGGSVIGSGNSSNDIRNNVNNTNNNANVQGQKQGQSQGQGQEQSIKNSGNSFSGGNTQTNEGNNSSQSVNVEGDTYEAQKRNPVATAYAASIMPTAVCALSTSGGAQGVGFGFSLGGSYIDDNCMLLEQVRAVSNLGEREVAQEMMMGVPAYAAAKKRIADRKSGVKAAVTGVDASEDLAFTVARAKGYQGSDLIVAKRIANLPSTK